MITWIQCEAGSCLLVGDPNKETLVELWPRRFHRSASTALRLHGSPRSRVWTLVVRHRQRVCATTVAGRLSPAVTQRARARRARRPGTAGDITYNQSQETFRRRVGR